MSYLARVELLLLRRYQHEIERAQILHHSPSTFSSSIRTGGINYKKDVHAMIPCHAKLCVVGVDEECLEVGGSAHVGRLNRNLHSASRRRDVHGHSIARKRRSRQSACAVHSNWNNTRRGTRTQAEHEHPVLRWPSNRRRTTSGMNGGGGWRESGVRTGIVNSGSSAS